MNVIEIRGVSKQYSGTNKKANNNISFDLKKGEILCIAGENGAGKTTLMRILCGLLKHDTGEVIIKGSVAMVHQHFTLFKEFTVAENIVIGKEPKKLKIFIDKKSTLQISDKIINENNFSIKSNVKVKDLTLGEMQQVEICRVIYRNADIIILDEPTSILTELEIKSLFITLRKMASEGKSIILITHKLNEIKQISDRVAVLRRGELKGIRNVADVDAEDISRMMIGEADESELRTEEKKSYSYLKFTPQDYISGEPVIIFKNVSVKRAGQKLPLLDNISFSACSGEILGFAGVGGNGLGVIEAVLGGFLHPASGKIYHKEKEISRLSIRALRRQGLAYVPSDRVHVGSAADASINENYYINEKDGCYGRKNKNEKIFDIIKKYISTLNDILKNCTPSWIKNSGLLPENIDKYNIDAPDLNANVSALSGGNLQKLILSREIDCLKDYIVFSNPSWGLDNESSSFIKKEILTLRNNGAAVILISTDLDEVIELSDRIAVMFKGKITKIINKNECDIKEKVGMLMSGGECEVRNVECGMRN